jgi:hypothetical protein
LNYEFVLFQLRNFNDKDKKELINLIYSRKYEEHKFIEVEHW